VTLSGRSQTLVSWLSTLRVSAPRRAPSAAPPCQSIRSPTLWCVNIAAGVISVVVGVPIGMGVAVVLYFAGGTAASPLQVALLLGLPFLVALPWLMIAPIRARRGLKRIHAMADALMVGRGHAHPAHIS
jgi:hypothetical protein